MAAHPPSRCGLLELAPGRVSGAPAVVRVRLGGVSATLAVLALALAPGAGAAQAPAIRDNSLLLEEAYNQDPGVVQHIGLLQRAGSGAGWQFTFTQEWPLWSQRHQLSYSLPVAGGQGSTGLADLGVHYRFQLLGGGEEPLALAPRLSLVLPTGDPAEGTGGGSVGLQFGVPASLSLGSAFVGHFNSGLGFTPSAEGAAGGTADALDFTAGASVVWLARPWVNLLVEGTWARIEEVTGPGATVGRTESYLSPGVRFGLNLAGGRQLVPAIAYAIALGDQPGAESLLMFYLSFEHPFGGRLTGAGGAGQLAVPPTVQAR